MTNCKQKDKTCPSLITFQTPLGKRYACNQGYMVIPNKPKSSNCQLDIVQYTVNGNIKEFKPLTTPEE